jgi:hypothetical protein
VTPTTTASKPTTLDIATPIPEISATPITLAQINSNGSDFAAFLTDIDARADLSEIPPLDSVADLQAQGSAIFEGAFYVYANAARVDGFVGNAALAVGFEDASNPTVTGGADGFVYVDGPELAEVIETDDFTALPNDTPTYVATGDIAFSNGELTNTVGVATAGFEIAGTLAADIGDGVSQTIDVTGAMGVLFDGNQAFGVGGDTDNSAFDLNTPEAFFFGTATR